MLKSVGPVGIIPGVLFVLWWPLAAGAMAPCLGALLVGVVIPSRRRRWHCREALTQLRAHRPPGGYCLFNFAGDPDHEGAGRELLDQVCEEADARHWILYLDVTERDLADEEPSEELVGGPGVFPGRAGSTPKPGLVDYYACSGFEASPAVVMAWGGNRVSVTRMVRAPGVGGPRPL